MNLVDNEMHKSLAEMGSILETLNDGIIIVDDCLRILFVNTVFEEMIGIPRSEIIGRDGRRLYKRAEDSDLVEAFHQRAFAAERTREEFFLPTKNGGRLPVVVSVRMMNRLEGSRFAVATVTDISEQKRTESELRAANGRLKKHQTEIEQELLLAARVQQSLAPEPLIWGPLSVETFFRPAHTIGGDFGLVKPLGGEDLNLLVCDVSGHGISSALVANRIYLETIVQLSNRTPLVNVLRQLNSLVIQNIGAQGFFFTLAAARIDRAGRSLEFAGAGHPPAMIIHPGDEPRLLLSRSMILGTLPDAVDVNSTLHVDLEAGDRIILYTDGLTDVFNPRAEMLGVEGLRNFIRETALLPFARMKQGILNRVAAWRDGAPVDDVSLVLVDVG
jgi:sigma-B regulation protein RsbU (phosphoserine phosphatase)